MSVTKETIGLIKRFEGLRLTIYYDPVGVPTGGYGHTLGLTGAMVGQHISEAQAEKWLREDLVKFEKKVDKYDSTYHWTENERGSLISFSFNVGSIDKLTAYGTRSKKEIADAMLNYNKAKGKVLNGLTKRRRAEREMFLRSNVARPTLKRGSSGDSVKELQRLLGISETGVFGSETEIAVKAYQKEKGLVSDGIVGKLTWGELLR